MMESHCAGSKSATLRTTEPNCKGLCSGTMQLLTVSDPNGNAVKINLLFTILIYMRLVLNTQNMLFSTHHFVMLYTKEMKAQRSNFDESSFHRMVI